MCCCMYRGEQTGVLPDCYTYAPSTDNRQIGIHHVVVKLYDRMRPKMTIEQNCLFVMSWQLGQFVILNQLADKFIEFLVQQERTKLVLLREAILQTMFLHPGRCSIHPHRSLPHQCLDGRAIDIHRLAAAYQWIGEKTAAQLARSVKTGYAEHRKRRIGLQGFLSNL